MSKQGEQSSNKLLFGVGIGALLLYFIFRKKDQSGGTSDTELVLNPNNLTFGPNQYRIFADAIENAIYGSYAIPKPWEDDTAVARILMEMQTDDDVAALIAAYGRRYIGILIQDGGNLVQTIQEYLDADLITQVNNNYQKKGITIRF